MFQGLEAYRLIRRFCLVYNDVEVGVGCKFGQGCPCFRLWLPLGIVNFVGFGGVSRSGGIWIEEEAYFVRNGSEGGVC